MARGPVSPTPGRSLPDPTLSVGDDRLELAELGRASDTLARLGPAIDAFLAGHAAAPYPAYRAGPDSPGARGEGGLPATGIGLDALIDELSEVVVHGCRIGAPGFVGFITTGSTTGPAIAAAASAFAGGQRYLLHAFNALEHQSLRWLADLCGLPAGVTGVYSSGGSTANLVALGAARQAAFERIGLDVAEQGAPSTPRGRIYASTLAHRTIHRSAAVLGLGRQSVTAIPVDGDGRIRLGELDAALRRDAGEGVIPIAVVAAAGATDTGSVDDIAGVVEVARRYSAWVHVDGAYGLVANASPRLASLFDGVADADSWIVDPHKWLATGVGVGATFVRDGAVLTRAFAEGDAAYLEGSLRDESEPARSQFDSMGGPWADQGVELSSPPRGVLVWAVLREIGRAGVAARVERHVAFARRVADRARSDPRLELVMEPQLSVVCFRYRPRSVGAAGGAADGPGPDRRADAINARILDRLRAETGFAPTSTRVAGTLVIRPCFINPRTTEREVDGLVDAVLRLGDEEAAR
jgi:aromatic-L-amino-acid decarboxylase